MSKVFKYASVTDGIVYKMTMSTSRLLILLLELDVLKNKESIDWPYTKMTNYVFAIARKLWGPQ